MTLMYVCTCERSLRGDPVIDWPPVHAVHAGIGSWTRYSLENITVTVGCSYMVNCEIFVRGLFSTLLLFCLNWMNKYDHSYLSNI